MAWKKISELSAITTPTWGEEIPCAYNWWNYKITLKKVQSIISPSLDYIDSDLAWENLSVWDVVIKNSNNQLVKATISNQGTMPKQAYIVRKATTSWQSVEYDFAWISNVLSWLTKWKRYYISSTAGTLTTNRNGWFLVWTAISSDSLLLHNTFPEIISWETYTLFQDTRAYYASWTSYEEKWSVVADEDMTVAFSWDVLRSGNAIAWLEIKRNWTIIFSDMNNTIASQNFTHDITLTKGQTLSRWTRKSVWSWDWWISNIYIKYDYKTVYK